VGYNTSFAQLKNKVFATCTKRFGKIYKPAVFDVCSYFFILLKLFFSYRHIFQLYLRRLAARNRKMFNVQASSDVGEGKRKAAAAGKNTGFVNAGFVC